jgi:hypothetical protein
MDSLNRHEEVQDDRPDDVPSELEGAELDLVAGGAFPFIQNA